MAHTHQDERTPCTQNINIPFEHSEGVELRLLKRRRNINGRQIQLQRAVQSLALTVGYAVQRRQTRNAQQTNSCKSMRGHLLLPALNSRVSLSSIFSFLSSPPGIIDVSRPFRLKPRVQCTHPTLLRPRQQPSSKLPSDPLAVSPPSH